MGLEMAQWLRTLSGLPEVQGSIPSTNMVAYNCIKLYVIHFPLLVCTYTCKQNIHIHILK